MDIRPELLPPSVPVARVEQLAREIRRIEHLLYDTDRSAAEGAVAAFAEATGHSEPADASAEQIVDAALAYRPIVL
ncbi:hypothetical protein [Streptomyces sp. NBC_01518]|uniref:hypothetical protein n=1 Tax=Streptomyces sp. NBC_01518 TaxID=2903891 RepID=UPI00386F74A8